MKVIADKDRIKTLYDAGSSFADIARQLGVSRQRVHQVAMEMGVESRGPSAPVPVTISTDKQEQLTQLFSQGVSGRRAAKIVGVSNDTAWRYQKRYLSEQEKQK